jgi:hypothetical protein
MRYCKFKYHELSAYKSLVAAVVMIPGQYQGDLNFTGPRNHGANLLV